MSRLCQSCRLDSSSTLQGRLLSSSVLVGGDELRLAPLDCSIPRFSGALRRAQ